MRALLLASLVALACEAPSQRGLNVPGAARAPRLAALALPPTRNGAPGLELERVWDSELRGVCQPLLADGALVVAMQPEVVTEPQTSPADYPGSIATLDAEGGAVLWQQRLAGWLVGCPVLVGGVVVAADGMETIHAFHLADGQRVWSQRVPGLRAGLVVAAGRVVASTLQAAVVAFDVQTGQRAWSTPWTRPLTTDAVYPPVLSEATLYVHAYLPEQRPDGAWFEHALFVAVDPVTGARRWERKIEGGFNEPLLHAWEGELRVVSDRSELVLLDARTGELRSRRSLGDPARMRSAMVFDRHTLYLSDLEAQSIRVVALASGREEARIPFESVPRRMSLRGDALVVDADDGYHAYHLPSAKPAWHLAREHGSGPLLWSGDVLYFAGWAVALRVHSLALRLGVDRSTLAPDESLQLQVTLANVRPQGELLLGTYLPEWSFRRRLEIRDSAGRLYSVQEPFPQSAPLRARSSYQAVPAGREWNVTVSLPLGPEPNAPGRTFVVDGKLHSSRLPPGDYELVAVYDNAEDTTAEIDPVYGPRVNTLPGVWKGRVRSEPVQFRIEAPQPSKP